MALLIVTGAPAVGAGLAVASSAPARAQDRAVALDQLSTTIRDLRASLSTMRAELEARHEGQGDVPALDQLCPAPSAGLGAEPGAAGRELDRLRAQVADERAAQQRRELATREELASLRQHVADDGAAAARFQAERLTLESRIADLERTAGQARSRDGVAAQPQRAPARAVATETDGVPSRATRIDGAPGPNPSGVATAVGLGTPSAADGGGDLELRSELAQAQLKIAELRSELQSAQTSRAAIEAEIRSLRSLTDARIKDLMGLQ